MPEKRGVIRNVARKQQINNFEGLLRGRNITPTDIDGFIDYGGHAFIYFEGKLMDTEIETGQKRALEAAVSSHWKAGHPSMALIYWHCIPADQQIPVAHQFIRGIYCLQLIPGLCEKRFNGSWWWFPTSKALSVQKAMDLFENHFNVFSFHNHSA